MADPDERGQANESVKDDTVQQVPEQPILQEMLEVIKAQQAQLSQMQGQWMQDRYAPHMHRVLPTQPTGIEESLDKKMANLVSRFKGSEPPLFCGSIEPMEAEKWLREVESSLQILRIPKEYWAELAAHQLKGNAQLWWRSVVRTQKNPHWSWQEFERLFLGKYFSEFEKEKMVSQFERLAQGYKTVLEYEQEFSCLLLFVEDDMMTERKIVRQFVSGLRPEIYYQMKVLAPQTFVEAVEKARLIEEGITVQQAPNTSKRQVLSPFKHQSQQIRQYLTRSTTDIHCYECGGRGHIKRQCPSMPHRQQPQQSNDVRVVPSSTTSGLDRHGASNDDGKGGVSKQNNDRREKRVRRGCRAGKSRRQRCDTSI